MYKMAEDQKAHPNTLSENSIAAKGKGGGGNDTTTKGPKNPLAGAERGPSHDENHANRKTVGPKGTSTQA